MKRSAFLAKALRLIRALRDDENKLHSGMPAHLAKVTQGKRILVLGALLQEIGHPDAQLVRRLSSGFPLFGWLDRSGIFAGSLKPPSLLPAELERLAPDMNQWIAGACKSSSSSVMDRALWDATMEDVGKARAEGPYDMTEASVLAGDRLVCSRRFAVQQKEKIRAIDDFSASNINRCTGAREKVRVESVDAAAVMIRQWMLALRGSGRQLVGKAFDVKAAYRQLGICPEHLHAAWICVYRPDTGKPAFFRLHALPFGASSSVSNFLRCAEAIKRLGTQLLFVTWTSFFDDYIVVCPEDCAAETDKAVRIFFQLLGWRLALEPEKRKPFATKFQALGVVFDLSRASEGIFWPYRTLTPQAGTVGGH